MIKRGDLVMVVRPSPRCGNTVSIGLVFRATDVRHGRMHCLHCRAPQEVVFVEKDGVFGLDASRLKKIDPLATGDTIPTRKEVKNEMETD